MSHTQEFAISGITCQATYSPLWWHDRGLSQTATGYGDKLTTPYKVAYAGRMRRVYCRCYSNWGTAYIIVKGERVVAG